MPPASEAAPGEVAPVAPGQAVPPAAAAVAPPVAVSRRVARAAAPLQAAPPAAPAAVRPLQPLQVPRPIFNEELANIPISGRQAARLNSMARAAPSFTNEVRRNRGARRRMDRAAVDRELELAEEAADAGSSRRAAATDAFLRARAHDEDVLNRFAYSPFF